MVDLVSVGVASLIFANILSVEFVDGHCMLLGQERVYSKLSKTFPFSIILSTVIDKRNFKEYNTNSKIP